MDKDTVQEVIHKPMASTYKADMETSTSSATTCGGGGVEEVAGLG